MKALIIYFAAATFATAQPFTLLDPALVGAATRSTAVVDYSTLTNNLVAYWHFDEGSAGSRVDSVAAMTLTQSGTVDAVAGKYGNALNFTNSAANYLTIADNAALSMGSGVDYTITFWAQLAVTNQTPQFFLAKGNNDNATKEYWVAYSTAAGYNSFYSALGDNTTAFNNFGQTKFQTNVWQLVVVRVDASEGDMTIQLNGTGTIYTNASASYSWDGTASMILGQRGGGSAVFGRMDELAIWKRFLTQAEVAALLTWPGL